MTRAPVIHLDVALDDETAESVDSALAGCFRLSFVVATLLAVVAGVGLLVPGFYRDNSFATAGFRGSDLVSVAVVLPALVISTLSARKGSVRAQMVWLRALGYVAYTYLYTFAIAFNRLFALYVVLLSLSAFTIVRALIAVDFVSIATRFLDRTSARRAQSFLWLIGGLLGLAELGQIIPSLFTGSVPELVTKTGHPTGVVYILDLGMVVPLMIMTGFWIRRGRPWAPVVAVILLVKGVTVGLALLAANLFAYQGNQQTDGPLIGLWLLIALGSVLVLGGYLKSMIATSPARSVYMP